MHSFWYTQDKSKPLFPDIEWNKPQQRNRSGKLAIVGGNHFGFRAVEQNYRLALSTGVGQVRVLLPDSLRKAIPITITDVVFAPSNHSGSLGVDARLDIQALAQWADSLLFIGDAGRNSQTAILYEEVIDQSTTPLVISRDAIDLILPNADHVVQQPTIALVASFAQTQKLFRRLYYPKILTFRMTLLQLVETLHKFTITYPLTLVTFHANTIIVARDGKVTTTPWTDPMSIWQGSVATRAAAYYLWNPSQPLQAITASLLDTSAIQNATHLVV